MDGFMAYGEEAQIGRWSIDKLDFLQRYLPAYLSVTKKAMHRYYVDGFAGRGEWINKSNGQKVDGSTVIALQQARKFTHLFFVEADEERAENLRNLARIHNAIDNTTVLVGDCNELLGSIMQRIHPRAPTFVFLDPSADQVKWSTIQTLSGWRTELFILFPLNMTLIRYMPKHRAIDDWARDRLDSFFGCNEWEDIYNKFNGYSRTRLMNELINLFMRRLRELGYEYTGISDVFRNDSGQKLYYMIWVGKNELGDRIMSAVLRQQGEQLLLF